MKTSRLPNLSGAVRRWVQRIIIQKIIKIDENFETREEKKSYDSRGTWQVFSPRQLFQVAEGQRHWSWFMVHTLTSLELDVGDRVEYEGELYRVMTSRDHSKYGYYEYSVIFDYQYQVPDAQE